MYVCMWNTAQTNCCQGNQSTDLPAPPRPTPLPSTRTASPCRLAPIHLTDITRSVIVAIISCGQTLIVLYLGTAVTPSSHPSIHPSNHGFSPLSHFVLRFKFGSRLTAFVTIWCSAYRIADTRSVTGTVGQVNCQVADCTGPSVGSSITSQSRFNYDFVFISIFKNLFRNIHFVFSIFSNTVQLLLISLYPRSTSLLLLVFISISTSLSFLLSLSLSLSFFRTLLFSPLLV